MKTPKRASPLDPGRGGARRGKRRGRRPVDPRRRRARLPVRRRVGQRSDVPDPDQRPPGPAPAVARLHGAGAARRRHAPRHAARRRHRRRRRARRTGCASWPGRTRSSSCASAGARPTSTARCRPSPIPSSTEGIVPGQQTWNRIRNIYDVELELLPGKIVSPLLGYTRNTYDGPGTTTYHLGENEFLLNQQVHSVDQLYRVGLGFNYKGIRAGFTQGWRMYDWKSVATLAPGAGSGNVTTPVLGQPLTADAIVGTQSNKINTPVTNAWITGTLFGRVKLIGTYIKADGEQRDELRRGGRRKVPVLRDRPLLLGPGRDGRLAGPDRLLEGLGAGRSQHHQQRRPLRRLGREQPRPRRAGADLAALPEHGHVRRPEHRRPAARGQRPHRRRRHEPGLRRRDHRPRARPLLRQRRLVPDPADGDRDPRRRRDRRPGRTGRPLRAPRQHLGGRRHVRPVWSHADRRLPPRRRRRADFPDRLHSSATGTASAAPGPTRTS